MGSNIFLYLGQIAYLLTLASYAFRNVILLRVTAIIGSGVAIYYGFNVQAHPLWIPILWNLGFILVNTFQLFLSYWRKRNVELNPLEEFLHKTILTNFPTAEVKSFCAIASEGTLEAGQTLIEFNTEIDYLYCLVHGTTDIIINGAKVAQLGPGRFIGEMSLLTQSKTRADVIAATDLKLLLWAHTDIDQWVDSDATRLSLLQSALGTQVVEELLKQKFKNPSSPKTGAAA